MCAFVATNKAPGVYIDEVQLPGAISGVGTSTAAFVGPALGGPIGVPIRLANWTEFLDAFGGGSAGPYIWQPPIYVTHAVRGFFAEGGADCWFVRIGTAKRAELTLKDRSGGGGNDTLVVRAKQEGTAADQITVEVQDASIATTVVTRAEAAITGALNSTVTLGDPADAAKFLAGDVVHLDDGANNEDGTVASSSGTAIALEAPLQQTYGAGTVRLADLTAGRKKFRVDSTTGIEPGSNLSIDQQGGSNDIEVVASVDAAGTVTLGKGLTNAYALGQADAAVDVATQEFTLIIGTEPSENLSMDPRHSRYFGSTVKSAVADVVPVDPPNVAPPPENMPLVSAAAPLANGADDNPAAALGDANAFKGGIDALRKIDEVNILCVPDRTDQDVQAYMIAHCDDMQDRFTILDPKPGSNSALIRTQRDALVSDRGVAALYYPQIVISRPVGPGRITVPPSGHVAGLYARTDNDRGVFKAPANAALRSALDLERRLADEDQGPLNEHGVNVIRSFPGRGIRVWGARTISENVQWRYVNVRRLLLFIEESIQEATQFVVFEPNEPALWEQVKRQVTDFLTRLWSDGALFGVTADQAFRVRVDEELNPPSVRQLGMLVIEVVVYPTTPAEFVVFRIIQQPGGPVVQE